MDAVPARTKAFLPGVVAPSPLVPGGRTARRVWRERRGLECVADAERRLGGPRSVGGCGRVAFVWAFTIAPQPDVGIPESTATKHYVDVYFWTDGGVPAGSIAPGFSSHMMKLTRSSPTEEWRVDGFWIP